MASEDEGPSCGAVTGDGAGSGRGHGRAPTSSRAERPSPARPDPSAFTAPERELIRRELHSRFGQDLAVAGGIMLRTWRGGPNAGQPKIPPAVRTLLDRGLVEVRASGPSRRATGRSCRLSPSRPSSGRGRSGWRPTAPTPGASGSGRTLGREN